MATEELNISNSNYNAASFLERVKKLFARDDQLLGSITQRSVLARSGSDLQHIITRIDVLPRMEKAQPSSVRDYGPVLFVSETLDKEMLLGRLTSLSENQFQVGEQVVHSENIGCRDHYDASGTSLSDWPARVFDISFGSRQLSYEPLLHSTLKSFSSAYDAVAEFLTFANFNGSSDSRMGHIQLSIPNLNARIGHLDFQNKRLTVPVTGLVRAESLKLKLSLNYKSPPQFGAVEKAFDGSAAVFELPFSPSELQLWLISGEGFLADFHDENMYRSAGSNAILPKVKQSAIYDPLSLEEAQLLPTSPPSQVFIVHGHNASVKESVARFVEKLGLEAIILHEQPNRGNTIIEKFERHAAVSFAIALVTGDDEARPFGSPGELKKRPRQNVIFEFGFFVGSLGRTHVCALLEEGVEIPSDYQGVVYIPLDAGGNWKLLLVRELKVAGFDVDANRAI
jgi:predicted nucleotide-binding protein